MAEVSASMVKELRERTGAGMMECKTALTESNGDVEAAIEYLRKRGMAQAAKRAGRVASEGVVGIKLSDDRTLGVLVQLDGAQGEATQHEAFKAFVNELAMHVAAAAPQFTTRAEVPVEAVEKEKEIYRAQMAESGKPANVIEKIIEGKLGAFYEQVCLVDQPTIRDPKVKVSQALDAVSKAVGSKVAIKGFARFKVGEANQA